MVFTLRKLTMSKANNSTVLITGANRGIGLEYVKQYATEGWQVIACCREPESAQALTELARQFECVKVVTLDVMQFAQIEDLSQQLKGQSLHVLINNAGVYPPSAFGQTDYDAWSNAFKVNTMSTLKLAESFLPHLAQAGHAKFLAMTSKMGSIDDNGSGGEYIYRSTKTALNMVVKSLSIDLSQYGIAVAALHPGWVRTDMGGPNGLINTQTSVSGLRKVIENLSMHQSGQFIAYDGKEINW
jgi:NAD(P)-dependent dehydrogenase (short-subunit alcohol dehydrogenase family)